MPARSPQSKRTAAAKAPDSSSLDDDRLEGKLLEELDDDSNFFNKSKKRKTAQAKVTTGQKGSSVKESTSKQVQPPATAKKVQLPATKNKEPSLPSSPAAVVEKKKEKSKANAKENDVGGEKKETEVVKPAKRSKVRPVPSFDEPSKQPTPKPAVKYGARKSAASKASDGSKSDSEDDDEAPAPAAKKTTVAKPVVELTGKKTSTPAPSLKKTSKKNETTRKSRVVLTPPPAVESESTKEAASPSLIHSPVAPSGEEEKDTGRVVKDRNKTLKRLAEYNADEAAASGAGSAGMVLDEIAPPASKKARTGESSASSIEEAKKDTASIVTVAAEVEEGNDAPEEPDASVEEGERSAVVGKEPVKAAPAAKSKSSAAPTKTSAVPTKAKAAPRKSKTTESATTNPPDLVSELPAMAYDKQLILKMIIAKLESTKNCDWYELSIQLGKEGIGGDIGGAKKGKKGQSKDKITGDELYELYHHVVLPALKTGKALWVDDPSAILSPASATIDTPAPDDIEMEELESEEEAPLPPKGQGSKITKVH